MVKVFKRYKLPRYDGGFQKELRNVDRERMVIHEEEAEKNNRNYLDTGLWYELQEEATKEYYRICQERNERTKALKAAKVDSSVELIKEAIAEATIEGVKRRGRKKGGADEN
jgi:hypothetical protein